MLAGLALEWLDLGSLELALADPRLKQDIYSYLAEQVYRREDERTRGFLKRTCCLENITAELANRLAGTDAAHRYLAHLAANRVFTFATGEEGAYRYHNLFRDFLRQRYLQEEGEPAFRRLQHETAAALEDVGETEMAVELYLNANQPLDALAVVARGGEAGLEGLPSERLRSWLGRLPPEAAAAEPWARLIAGQLRSRDGDYPAALREIDRAVRSLEAAADEWGPVSRALHEGVRALLAGRYRRGRARLRGRPRARADRSAEDAHAAQPRLCGPRSAPLGRRGGRVHGRRRRGRPRQPGRADPRQGASRARGLLQG